MHSFLTDGETVPISVASGLLKGISSTELMHYGWIADAHECQGFVEAARVHISSESSSTHFGLRWLTSSFTASAEVELADGTCGDGLEP
jgi:hypothetical protein